jgi:hypothetical protein
MLETLAWIGLGATLVPAHRTARATPSVLAALVAVEVIALALCVLAGLSERTWATIAQEDGLVEWATFLSFFVAAGWLVVGVRKKSASVMFKVACLLLAAFCVVVAGEEISWGQRLFGFKPPDVFLERNFQQEMNLHNVLMDERGLGFKLESKHLVMAIVAGFCGAWPWLVRRKRFEVFGPLAPPLALAPLAVGVIAAQLAYDVELTGEGAELIAGLIFLAFALTAGDRAPRAVVAWIAGTCVAAVLVTFVFTRIVYGSDEEGTHQAQTELAVLAEDIASGATDKLLGKNVHKRVYTAARDGYVRTAAARYLEGQPSPADADARSPRRDRRGYFLDPWNNPYWVHYNKKSRSGAVYSFGPNRRRDVTIRDSSSDPGDDVVVRFTLANAAPADSPDGDAANAPPALPR